MANQSPDVENFWVFKHQAVCFKCYKQLSERTNPAYSAIFCHFLPYCSIWCQNLSRFDLELSSSGKFSSFVTTYNSSAVIVRLRWHNDLGFNRAPPVLWYTSSAPLITIHFLCVTVWPWVTVGLLCQSVSHVTKVFCCRYVFFVLQLTSYVTIVFLWHNAFFVLQCISCVNRAPPLFQCISGFTIHLFFYLHCSNAFLILQCVMCHNATHFIMYIIYYHRPPV